MKLEYYVLNYDFNKKEVVPFNIFGNYYVNQKAVELATEYLTCKLPYDEMKEEFRRAMQYELWGRRQYEISVGDAFEDDCSKLEKWDCYAQALPNLELIVRYIVKEVQRDIAQKG